MAPQEGEKGTALTELLQQGGELQAGSASKLPLPATLTSDRRVQGACADGGDFRLLPALQLAFRAQVAVATRCPALTSARLPEPGAGAAAACSVVEGGAGRRERADDKRRLNTNHRIRHIGSLAVELRQDRRVGHRGRGTIHRQRHRRLVRVHDLRRRHLCLWCGGGVHPRRAQFLHGHAEGWASAPCVRIQGVRVQHLDRTRRTWVQHLRGLARRGGDPRAWDALGVGGARRCLRHRSGR
mmetsp:Transcript_12557/g.36052  ORF Transcript_12557/g.36052 Transcript_12557/m.36052 type:complete len:241 (+) Transcript_12557:118-840(+)